MTYAKFAVVFGERGIYIYRVTLAIPVAYIRNKLSKIHTYIYISVHAYKHTRTRVTCPNLYFAEAESGSRGW